MTEELSSLFLNKGTINTIINFKIKSSNENLMAKKQRNQW